MLVPEGIGAEDAVYMPSMETALAIVHDAGQSAPAMRVLMSCRRSPSYPRCSGAV